MVSVVWSGGDVATLGQTGFRRPCPHEASNVQTALNSNSRVASEQHWNDLQLSVTLEAPTVPIEQDWQLLRPRHHTLKQPRLTASPIRPMKGY